MIGKYKVFIFTENPEKLVKFYTEILGFKVVKELHLPKDWGYTVEAEEDCRLWIAKHSEVKGYNKEPVGHIINFYTDDIKGIYKKVKAVPGVKIIQKPISMSEINPEETRQVFTMLDPDGNCLQFMG